MAANGLTDKQIAGDLGLSIGTVRTYWSRIRNKLDAATRAQAVGLLVRGVTQVKDDAAADILSPITLLCEKAGLPCWKVDGNWSLLGAVNRTGERFLEGLAAVLGTSNWMSALDASSSVDVRNALGLASSRNPGRVKVVRARFVATKKNGHLLLFPPMDGETGCVVVFVAD